MTKKLFILFKIGRKLAKSDALNIATRFNEPPIAIKILFKILGFSFTKKKELIKLMLIEKNFLILSNQWVQLL